jgi:serine protease Do
MKAMLKKANLLAFGQVLGALALLVVVIAAGTGRSLASDKHDPANTSGVMALREMGKAFATVAKEASPAVVGIKVERTMKGLSQGSRVLPFGDEGESFGGDLFKRFFGPQAPNEAPNEEFNVMGQGSGFLVSADGRILTNSHVVADAEHITVTLLDGREFAAKVIGSDPRSDVAVLKIDAKDLPFLAMGDSDNLEVGEWVIAVGNPFGLSHTVTSGIVSARGRNSVGIADYEDFIQTDAAINPGNSGGPLLDLEGKVVGVNTAIFSRTGGHMGIGFAIPANMVKQIETQLVTSGSVTRGYLGIVIQDLTKDLAKTFDLKNAKGILVSQVTKGSPAERSGFKRGDVITKLDGKPVGPMGSFRNQVSLMEPGSKVPITVLRDGKPVELTAAIGKLADEASPELAHAKAIEELGLTVQNLTPDLAEQFGFSGEEGVVVTQVKRGSAAALAEMRPGVLIQEVNHAPVKNVAEFRAVIEKASSKDVILLLVKDREYAHYVTIRPHMS